MHLLLPRPGAPTSDAEVDVHAHYAAGWLQEEAVRVNFISSADGAAAADGLSRQLQTPGDNTVFAALRDLADVILVGAATATAEGYRPSVPGARRQRLRSEFGLPPAPAIAVVSGQLNLELDAPLYTEASLAPTIVITGSAAPVARRNDIIDLAGSRSSLQLLQVDSDASGGVDFAAAVAALRAQGFRHILCEGGPRLFAAGVAAGAIDELCVSYSPKLIGPGAPRIVAGSAWPAAVDLELTGLLAEDGALFARYRLPRSH
ncbi:MAG TPA: dihydrofolate reductase family protein [Jatrophihabitans sp.]|nr:dihydrofolate reductase family protein [Jatrophihabitans sp.]